MPCAFKQRPRFGDLRHFGRRRKVLERGREDGMGVSGTSNRLVEFRKREGCEQLVTSCALRLRNHDRGLECFLGATGTRGAPRQQDFAAKSMEVGVGEMLPRLLRDRQSLVDQREGAVRIPAQVLKLCEQTVERRSAALVAKSEIRVQRSPQLKRPRLRIESPTAGPARVYLRDISVSLQVVLFCQSEQGFGAEACGGDVPAAAFNDGLEIKRAGGGRDVAQFGGASGRSVGKLSGALHLPQMPFRQGEKVGGAQISVITEPEQRFSFSFMDVVAQCLLEDRPGSL